jgi:hypothetical protein
VSRSFIPALAFGEDPRRKLMWVHNPISFWVLKFDPATAKLEEVKD